MFITVTLSEYLFINSVSLGALGPGQAAVPAGVWVVAWNQVWTALSPLPVTATLICRCWQWEDHSAGTFPKLFGGLFWL